MIILTYEVWQYINTILLLKFRKIIQENTDIPIHFKIIFNKQKTTWYQKQHASSFLMKSQLINKTITMKLYVH